MGPVRQKPNPVDRQLESVRYSEISNRLINVQSQLKVMDKYVNLVYVPRHSGITGNTFSPRNAYSAPLFHKLQILPKNLGLISFIKKNEELGAIT